MPPAAFVLWYAAPPVAAVADYTGTPGAVMCLFGAGLALVSAMQAGHVSIAGWAVLTATASQAAPQVQCFLSLAAIFS